LQLPEGKFFKVTLKKLGEQQEYLIKRWSAWMRDFNGWKKVSRWWM
jgi:hypothetical protein